jgi:hypothetical protein
MPQPCCQSQPVCNCHPAVPTAQLADNLAGSLQLGDPQPQAQQLQQRHVPQPPPPGGGYYAAAPWGAAAGPPPPPHQQQLPGYYNNRPVGYAGAQGQGWYPQQQQQQQRPPGPRVSTCWVAVARLHGLGRWEGTCSPAAVGIAEGPASIPAHAWQAYQYNRAQACRWQPAQHQSHSHLPDS